MKIADNCRITSICPFWSSSPHRFCGKNLSFFAFGFRLLTFPWVNSRFCFVSSGCLGFLVTELQLVRSTSDLSSGVCCSSNSLTCRLLQTSINALPISRPDQVSVPGDRCVARQAKCSTVLQRGLETHSDGSAPFKGIG